jgi:hypothetical protein
MGMVNWFLGTHFTWLDHADGHLSVYMCQVTFTQNLIVWYQPQNVNFNAHATPYRSGLLPIDCISPATEPEDYLAFQRGCLQYQSVFGSITWIATTTHLDLSPVTSFLVALLTDPHHCTWTLLSPSASIFTQPQTVASPSTPMPHLLRQTMSSNFTIILNHSRMPYHPQQLSTFVSLLTPICVGVVNWAPPFHLESKFTYKLWSMMGYIIHRSCCHPITWVAVWQ